MKTIKFKKTQLIWIALFGLSVVSACDFSPKALVGGGSDQYHEGYPVALSSTYGYCYAPITAKETYGSSTSQMPDASLIQTVQTPSDGEVDFWISALEDGSFPAISISYLMIKESDNTVTVDAGYHCQTVTPSPSVSPIPGVGSVPASALQVVRCKPSVPYQFSSEQSDFYTSPAMFSSLTLTSTTSGNSITYARGPSPLSAHGACHSGSGTSVPQSTGAGVTLPDFWANY
jgi:hypothetical protein